MPAKKQIDTDPNPNLLTDAQVCAELHICDRSLRNLRSKKGMPCLRISGRLVLTRRSDLDRWLNQFAVNALN